MHISRKILKSFTIWSYTIWSFVLTSCRSDEVIYPTIGTHVTDEVRTGGLYVLCEGNMGSNKARLDYMNLETGDYYANWYGSQNPTQLKELGDVGNEIQQYGNRLYAVINCSHKVEVMDLQARHIGKVDIPNCRNIAFHGDKMYVSAYVGSVSDAELLGSVYEVDTATLQVTREVKVGHQPDELCIVGNTLYVCNSGGYLINRYDSTVSVVNVETMTQEKQIPVGLNPTRLRVDNSQRLWVCCQGDYNSVSAQVVVLQDEQVIQRIKTPCANISLTGSDAYVIDNEENAIRVISLVDFSIRSYSPASPSTFEHLYGILATDESLYITDAKNYVSSGVLYCFGLDGKERWHTKTGDIPGHLCRVSTAYSLYSDSVVPQAEEQSPYIAHVYEYMPSMGQFVNELPKYEEGDDALSMCRKCEVALAHNAQGLVSLGGWGGYITFGFNHAVRNGEGRDLQILGNAFYMSGSTEYGSSEPGIVLVSQDANANGVPDDVWYELKGCLYDAAETNHHYVRTYTRQEDTVHNSFHNHSYYPQWIKEDELTFTGCLLPKQTVTINGQNVQRVLEYGYVDNKPNSDIEGTSFDLSWAVDEHGNAVQLDSIHFVRVYNAVDEVNLQTGELSTEIQGAIDLHINN